MSRRPLSRDEELALVERISDPFQRAARAVFRDKPEQHRDIHHALLVVWLDWCDNDLAPALALAKGPEGVAYRWAECKALDMRRHESHEPEAADLALLPDARSVEWQGGNPYATGRIGKRQEGNHIASEDELADWLRLLAARRQGRGLRSHDGQATVDVAEPEPLDIMSDYEALPPGAQEAVRMLASGYSAAEVIKRLNRSQYNAARVTLPLALTRAA